VTTPLYLSSVLRPLSSGPLTLRPAGSRKHPSSAAR